MMIYPVMVAMVKGVHALSRKVQRHDPDLARQMRRSSSSVPLNAVEGWYAYGGNRVARFSTAIDSVPVSRPAGSTTRIGRRRK